MNRGCPSDTPAMRRKLGGLEVLPERRRAELLRLSAAGHGREASASAARNHEASGSAPRPQWAGHERLSISKAPHHSKAVV